MTRFRAVLSNVLTTIRRRMAARTSSPAFDPNAYWERRHQTFRDSLKAVAHVRLSDRENAEQYEIKRSRILDMIRRYVPEPAGRSLLDAGCGIGLLTETFVQRGFDVVGVDLSRTAVARAKAGGIQAQFVVSPLADLDLERRFDVITAVDVLLHIVDRRTWHAALAALQRHLKPDGVLIVLDWLGAGAWRIQPHLRVRSPRQYAGALAHIGLRIVEHERFHLDHEGSTKDLLAIRHHTAAGLSR